jgi:hypothetical protein
MAQQQLPKAQLQRLTAERTFADQAHWDG